MLLVGALFLLGGYLLKAQCLDPWVDFIQYRTLCYNDIQPLWGARGIAAGTFPYIHGSLAGSELIEGAIEYPVLTGLFMWFTGRFVTDVNGYLVVSSIALAPFGLAIAYFLARTSGWRALMWSAAPALIWYSFHNWDLLAVACVVAGFWAWQRGAPVWAAILFGIGGAFKVYPLFFVAPLLLERIALGDYDRATGVAAGGAGAWAAANAPFITANIDGWSATYRFHSLRGSDFNSFWQWAVPQWGPETLNRVTLGLTLLSFVVALGLGWWRSNNEARYPFVQVSAAMLAAFLLWSKVHSPQYALWILPFFALVRIHPLWWVAYSAVDTIFYVGIFRWFYDKFHLGLDATAAKQAMLIGIWGRAGLLLVLFAVFLLAREAAEPPPEPAGDRVLSHPPPTLDPVGASVAN